MQKDQKELVVPRSTSIFGVSFYRKEFKLPFPDVDEADTIWWVKLLPVVGCFDQISKRYYYISQVTEQTEASAIFFEKQ